jgi:prevent-host-death family protein
MRYMPVSRARAQLADLVESIDRTVITKNGEPVAVLMHVDDYRAHEATRRLAAQPEALSRLQEAHEAVLKGDWDRFVDVERGDGGALDFEAAARGVPRPPSIERMDIEPLRELVVREVAKRGGLSERKAEELVDTALASSLAKRQRSKAS